MSTTAGYVSADYLRLAAERGQAFKRKTHDLLRPGAGDAVLDVGCGPGLDSCALAERLGPEGRVVGVDIDEAMLAQADAEARERGLEGRVLHRRADVSSLPFADAAFDAVRAERLLQVLPATVRPETAAAEMWRVLRPGGRLLLADADWGSASVDADDAGLERRLMHFFAARLRPNGYAGRQLFNLARGLGAADIELDLVPMTHLDLALLPFGRPLAEKAAAQGAISADEAARWIEELERRLAQGRFYATVNMVIVAARKPG